MRQSALTIFQTLSTSVRMLLAMTLLTGVIYPTAITLAAQVFFHHRGSGSLIERNGGLLGSELIGQSFSSPRYFWSRPSATAVLYDAGASCGSNYGPMNPAHRRLIEERVAALHASDPGQKAPIPIDLVTASASGLDPHISPAAARWQLPRVARERGVPENAVSALLEEHVEGRTLGLLGEPRVNVVRLNLALDRLH